MGSARISIAALMAAMPIIALDATIWRSLTVPSPHGPAFISTDHLVAGTMPMASLLLFCAAAASLRGQQRGIIPPFLLGFEVFGFASTFLFILWLVLDAGTRGYFEYGDLRFFDEESRVVLAIQSRVSDAPDWAQPHLALLAYSAILTTPQLLFALAGGWIAQKAGISIRIERRRSGPPDRPGSAGLPQDAGPARVGPLLPDGSPHGLHPRHPLGEGEQLAE